jgi:hypothetical protein
VCDRCLLLGLFNNANSAVDILVTIAKDSVTSTSQKLLKDVVQIVHTKKNHRKLLSIALRAWKISKMLVLE